MTLATLIVGGSPEERLAQIDSTPGPDRLIIYPDKSIGIKAVRQLQKFLQQKPYQREVKTAIINQAETMTAAAQQAILKTLEEPPAHSQIILLCRQADLLLDTIVSRCRIQNLANRPLDNQQIDAQALIFNQISRAAVAQRFVLVGVYAADPVSARDFVGRQLEFLHHRLVKQPESTNVPLIKALVKAQAALEANVNPKLTLEVLSLSY